MQGFSGAELNAHFDRRSKMPPKLAEAVVNKDTIQAKGQGKLMNDRATEQDEEISKQFARAAANTEHYNHSIVELEAIIVLARAEMNGVPINPGWVNTLQHVLLKRFNRYD